MVVYELDAEPISRQEESDSGNDYIPGDDSTSGMSEISTIF